MQRLSAVGVLLAVEIFIRFETGVIGIAELTDFLIGRIICRLRPGSALRLRRIHGVV